MRSWLQFGGRSSEEFGCSVTRRGYDAPQRDQDEYEAPGRDGTLIVDNGRWKNVLIPYTFGCCGMEKYYAARSWLLSQRGYRQLRDTYDETHFRLAEFNGLIEPDVALRRIINFVVEFNCHPLRFLEAGQRTIELTDDASVRNFWLDSYPRLTIYGTGGALSINGQSIVISEIDEFVTIDNGTAFKGGVNKNATVTMPDRVVLESGENDFVIGAGITKVEIVPRWCEI